jgi:monothiol glutaredoxin
MSLSPEVRAQIEKLIGDHKVVLFMKGNKHFPQCGFSSRVVKMLKETGVPFEGINVLSDPNLREGIKEFSEWPTIPQLYVDREFLGGCDIVTEMFQNGELHQKLGVKPVANDTPPTLTLTEAARTALKDAQEPGTAFYIECSDEFRYELYFDAPKKDGHHLIALGDLTVVVPFGSAKQVNGLKLDFVTTKDGGAFKIDNPNEPPKVRPVQAEDLKAWLDKGEAVELFDVRGEDERTIAKIAKARALNAEGEAFLQTLPKDTRVVMHCHHGVRSRRAAEQLLAQGFTNVWNLEGGIDAWSRKVDASIPLY